MRSLWVQVQFMLVECRKTRSATGCQVSSNPNTGRSRMSEIFLRIETSIKLINKPSLFFSHTHAWTDQSFIHVSYTLYKSL